MSWNLNITGFPWPRIRSCIPSHEYSLEGLMLKLKLQYFGHLMQRTDSMEKTLMLGKIEGGRRGWQRMRWLDLGHEFEQTPEVGDGQGSLVSCSPWGCKESDTTEQLNWTEPSRGSRRSNPDHRIISTKKLIHPKAGNACLPGESRIIAEFKN